MKVGELKMSQMDNLLLLKYFAEHIFSLHGSEQTLI